jgi:hypothetical protein
MGLQSRISGLRSYVEQCLGGRDQVGLGLWFLGSEEGDTSWQTGGDWGHGQDGIRRAESVERRGHTHGRAQGSQQRKEGQRIKKPEWN